MAALGIALLPGMAAASGQTIGAPAPGRGTMSMRPTTPRGYGSPSSGEIHLTRGARESPAAASSGLIAYQGGHQGTGVVTGASKVYVVFWGSQWGAQSTAEVGGSTFAAFHGDPVGMAPLLQAFYAGLGTGAETWSGIMTTYCQSSSASTVRTGATACPPGATHVVYPSGGALAGVWEDTSSAAPGEADQIQIAAEARAAAAHFGQSGSGAASRVQYVIVSPHNTSPDGFGTSSGDFCAWHDVTTSGDGSAVLYTNLPYVPDAGYSCGANYVNSGAAGALDGVTVIASHEYAETLTDPYVAYGWFNSSAGEASDMCSWVPLDQHGAGMIATGTGAFAVTGVWDNAVAGGRGGCELSHRIVMSHAISVANPGTMSATAAAPVRPIAVQAIDVPDPSGATGTAAVPSLRFSASGLPAGLSINPTTGVITGSPRGSGGIAHVTVTVTDSTGGVGIVRFTLIVRDPIVISRIRSVRTWAGAPARLRIVAHDTRGGRIRYSASGLPRGIAINPRTGLISGRIRGHARAYRVTITARGAGGVQANTRFRWTVR